MSFGTACQGRAATRAPGVIEGPGGPPERVPFEREPPTRAAPVAVNWDGRACAKDPRVLACASGRDGGPHLLGLAARGGTIAAAEVFAGNSWMSAARGAGARVRVGLYDAELRARRHVEVPLTGTATDVDMSHRTDGWVVAAQTAGGVELIRLAEDGEPGARTLLARARYPGLAAGPGGELLVVHIGPREGAGPVMASLVEPDGAVRWSVEVFEGSIEPNFGAQVAADDGGFLVARRTSAGVAVARVEPTGAVGARHSLANTTEYPSLAWCGGEGRLVWSEFSGQAHVRGAVIDRAGKRSPLEHVLGATPHHFNHSPVLCDGAGSLALLAGYTGGTGVSKSLDLTRVDRERGPLPGALAVLAPEGPSVYDPRMVRLDARRVAIGWIALNYGGEFSRLGLAVVDAPVAADALKIAE